MREIVSDAKLLDLRLRYNAAFTAYQSCVLALNDAALSGKGPTPQLLHNELMALRELTHARGDFLQALAGTVDPAADAIVEETLRERRGTER